MTGTCPFVRLTVRSFSSSRSARDTKLCCNSDPWPGISQQCLSAICLSNSINGINLLVYRKQRSDRETYTVIKAVVRKRNFKLRLLLWINNAKPVLKVWGWFGCPAAGCTFFGPLVSQNYECRPGLGHCNWMLLALDWRHEVPERQVTQNSLLANGHDHPLTDPGVSWRHLNGCMWIREQVTVDEIEMVHLGLRDTYNMNPRMTTKLEPSWLVSVCLSLIDWWSHSHHNSHASCLMVRGGAFKGN